MARTVWEAQAALSSCSTASRSGSPSVPKTMPPSFTLAAGRRATSGQGVLEQGRIVCADADHLPRRTGPRPLRVIHRPHPDPESVPLQKGGDLLVHRGVQDGKGRGTDLLRQRDRLVRRRHRVVSEGQWKRFTP